jgi:putative flippase GtrA
MLKLWNLPFVRFLFVGVINTLVGLSLIYLLLNLAGLNYWISTFIGNGCGALVSYTLNKRFTFRSDAAVSRSLWKFITVIVACYFLAYSSGLYIGERLLAAINVTDAELVHNAAVLFGTGLYTVSNYLGHKYFTFRTTATRLQRGEMNET